MWLARVICSDPDCSEVQEMLVEALSDLDGLGCECGYGVILVAVSEAEAAA